MMLRKNVSLIDLDFVFTLNKHCVVMKPIVVFVAALLQSVSNDDFPGVSVVLFFL